MAFNVDNFKAQTLLKEGPSRPSHFEVNITKPSFVEDAGLFASTNNLRLLCKSATMPGTLLQTSIIPSYGYGPMINRPTQATFNDVNLVFIVDSNIDVYWFFKSWTDYIAKTTSGRGADRFKFEFAEQYTTTVDITKYKSTGQETHTIQLIDAFPVNVGELNLDWDDKDSINTLSVSFAYTTYELGVNAE